MLSGAVAQYGRGVGMIQATAAQIINQFAKNLRTQLEKQPAAAPAAADNAAPSADAPLPEAAKPIAGISLGAKVLWQQLTKRPDDKS
jgi:hypothetical protein